MPQPERVDHPSKLPDEALGCHVLGHVWWVTRIKDAGISIGRVPQQRRYFACARGCGCTKRCLTDSYGADRWGWSRRQGEKYGTIGGWRIDDMWEEVTRREQSDPDWKIPSSGFGFEFDDDKYEIIVVRKPRKVKRGKAAGAA